MLFDIEEIWKDIPGYENIYWISNKGRVKSKNKILKLSVHRDGYMKAGLCVNGKVRTYQVHRLVALAFIPNPNNLPQINHKDENKTNNCVGNLEWCTMEYNIFYGTGQERGKTCRGLPANAKQVLQYSLDGKLLAKYPSGGEASRKTGVAPANISSCARHIRYQMGGYVWRYEGDPFTPVPEPKRGKEIVQLDKEGNIIKVWPNIISASIAFGMKYPCYLQDCIKGRKPTCRGFVWKYKSEIKDDVI